MPSRTLAVLLLTSCAVVIISIAQDKEPVWALKFQDFAVSDIFQGKPALPILATQAQRMFRTAIRRAVAKGPNFAGHFTIAAWGCGAGCVSAALVDTKTGRIYSMPFGSLSMPIQENEADRQYQGPVYQLKSRLFIADGCLDEDEKSCGTHYYEWKDHQFRLLRLDGLQVMTK